MIIGWILNIISRKWLCPMMASQYENVFCIAGLLWGESTSYWWIPLTKGQQCKALMCSLLLASRAVITTNSSATSVDKISIIDTLRPKQNVRHFADNIFKCSFLNGNVWILIEISLKFVPKDPINNISALVQIMAWRWPDNKPLPESMMVWSPTHICVTRPQRVQFNYRIKMKIDTLRRRQNSCKRHLQIHFLQ